jgi:lysozyme
MNKFNVSFDDTQLIRNFEGERLEAYPDPASGGDPWTISWGLTGDWVVEGLVITPEESVQRFMARISDMCDQLDNIITSEVNKNQYMALLSFAWNIGISKLAGSTLMRKVNAGDFDGAADEFLRWNKAGGQVMAGLTHRRTAEQALFEKEA